LQTLCPSKVNTYLWTFNLYKSSETLGRHLMFLGDHLMGHFHVSIRSWSTLSLRLLNVRQWVVVVYGWSPCLLKTIESNDNVVPKLQCLARWLTKRLTYVAYACNKYARDKYACDTSFWVFCILEGENIVRDMLNKLPLSLFLTKVKLTFFITCVQKVCT
jgi:hypothetical protein